MTKLPLRGQACLRISLSLLAVMSVMFTAPLRATSVVPPTFEQLVNDSDYIVRALVKSVHCEWRAKKTESHIFTLVELDVQEVIAGSPPSRVVLELLGGKIGDQQLVLEGAPQFKEGDEDILFISGNGRSVFPLVSMMYGRYPVIRDGPADPPRIARSNRAPLYSTAQVEEPLMEGSLISKLRVQAQRAEAMSAEDFVRVIRGAQNPSYTRRSQ